MSNIDGAAWEAAFVNYIESFCTEVMHLHIYILDKKPFDVKSVSVIHIAKRGRLVLDMTVIWNWHF